MKKNYLESRNAKILGKEKSSSTQFAPLRANVLAKQRKRVKVVIFMGNAVIFFISCRMLKKVIQMLDVSTAIHQQSFSKLQAPKVLYQVL